MPIIRWLLAAGVASGALFLAGDIVAGSFFYPGYDFAAQQVSELSAIGAPSRAFWMVVGYPYSILTLVFAIGVWLAADRLPLRVAAVLIGLFALNGYAWGLFAPMHMRGAQFDTTDTMHLVFAASAVLLMLGFIAFGAAAFGRGFRIYSALTVLAMLVAGGIVSTQIARIAANEPTPWMGLVERISVHGPGLWLAVFAVMLMRQERWLHAPSASLPSA